jgi:hypothetical protein
MGSTGPGRRRREIWRGHAPSPRFDVLWHSQTLWGFLEGKSRLPCSAERGGAQPGEEPYGREWWCATTFRELVLALWEKVFIRFFLAVFARVASQGMPNA